MNEIEEKSSLKSNSEPFLGNRFSPFRPNLSTTQGSSSSSTDAEQKKQQQEEEEAAAAEQTKLASSVEYTALWKEQTGWSVPSLDESRDLYGYGDPKQVPTFTWPDHKKVAVSFVLNFEEGGEVAVGDGDSRNETVYEVVDSVQGARDYCIESHFEYGTRVGYWRIMEMFDRYGVKITVSSCGRAVERSPWLPMDASSRGHEIAAHGYRWMSHAKMSESEEIDAIDKCIEAIQRVSGRPPVGWHTRSERSPNTRRLLVERGFLYSDDAYNDDSPYYVDVGGRLHLILPYAFDTNDMQFQNTNRFDTASSFAEYVCDTFDFLSRSSESRIPRIMTIGLHLRIIGRPGRMLALEQILEHITRAGNAWIVPREQIALHWIQMTAVPTNILHWIHPSPKLPHAATPPPKLKHFRGNQVPPDFYLDAINNNNIILNHNNHSTSLLTSSTDSSSSSSSLSFSSSSTSSSSSSKISPVSSPNLLPTSSSSSSNLSTTTNPLAVLRIPAHCPKLTFLLINPNTNPAATELIHKHLLTVIPNNNITLIPLTATVGQRTICSESSYAFAEYATLETYLNYRKSPEAVIPDGILVGCFGDPGVFALRELIAEEGRDIPVIGLAEASIRYSQHLPGKAAVVTGGRPWVPILTRLARSLGLHKDLSEIRAVDLNGTQLAEDRPRGIAILQEACRLVLVDSRRAPKANRCTSIILGGGLLAGMAAEIERPEYGVLFIDSVSCSIEILYKATQVSEFRKHLTEYQKI